MSENVTNNLRLIGKNPEDLKVISAYCQDGVVMVKDMGYLKIIECLMIKCNEIFNKNYEINFYFACDSIITLISETIEVILCDLGKAWNVKHIPNHKI